MIYLDFNRTSPLAPSVLEAMQPYWATHFMLPGQQHSQAKAVSEAIEHARENVAGLIGCEAFELVFTSGGTEANNLGVLGTCQSDPQNRGQLAQRLTGLAPRLPASSSLSAGHVLAGPAEHDSVQSALDQLAAGGWDIETLPSDSDGSVEPSEVAARIRPETKLVCIQLANATLGVIQPVRAITALAHQRGVRVHCDTTAAAGRVPVDVAYLDVDSASVSGHRFYGPKGGGAIFVRRGNQLQPQLFGDTREMGLRPGAENVPAIVGLGAAASLASRCLDDALENLQELRERMIAKLAELVPGGFRVLCEDVPRTPGTLCIEAPAEAKRIQAKARHLVFSIASQGSPHDSMRRSLQATGMPEHRIERTLQLSFGWTTSREQIDRAAEAIASACDD